MKNPKIIRLKICLILSMSFYMSPGHAELKFPSGKVYPDKLSLIDQIIIPKEKQAFGACHIYAAVSAVESSCYRNTKTQIKISEAYEFYRHTRAQLESPKSQKFIIDTKDGQFSANDAGAYEVTLARLLNEGTMHSEQFKMSDIKEALKSSFPLRHSFQSLNPEHKKQVIDAYEEQVKRILKASLDKKFIELSSSDYQSTTDGYKYKLQNDNPVSRCEFNEMRYRNIRSTPESAVAFLSKGFPIICQHYSDPKNPSKGQHVYVLGGYAKRPEIKHGVGFMVRNSNSLIPLDTGYEYNCKYSTIVYNKSEEAVVRVIEQNVYN